MLALPLMSYCPHTCTLTHTHTLTLVPIRSGQWPFWYLASKLPLANDLARLTVLKNKRKEKLISATSGSQIDINKVSIVSADTLPQCEGEESVCSERLASPHLTSPRRDSMCVFVRATVRLCACRAERADTSAPTRSMLPHTRTHTNEARAR